MSTTKSHKLNREKILPSIKSFKGISEMQMIHVNHYRIRYNEEGQSEAQVDVYFKNDGTTTLTNAQCRNKAKSEELVQCIIDNCTIKDVPNKAFYISKITNDEFDVLLDEIQSYGATIEDKNSLLNGTKYKIKGILGDTVHITRFKTGSFQIQGNGVFLKGVILELLTDFLPYKDVIEKQLESLDIQLNATEAIDKLQQRIPYAFNYLRDKLKAIISPSIVLNELELDLSDYSVILYPILRGLEGVIKQIFEDHQTITFKSLGDYFDVNESGQFFLRPEYKKFFKYGIIALSLERLMEIYNKYRHVLFHVDGETERTKIIKDRQEAQDIFDEAIMTIDDAFRKMQSSYPKKK